MEFFAWDIRMHAVWREEGELRDISFSNSELAMLSLPRKPIFVQKDQKLDEVYEKMGYKV
jgi:hypothetical protein